MNCPQSRKMSACHQANWLPQIQFLSLNNTNQQGFPAPSKRRLAAGSQLSGGAEFQRLLLTARQTLDGETHQGIELARTGRKDHPPTLAPFFPVAPMCQCRELGTNRERTRRLSYGHGVGLLSRLQACTFNS